LRRGGLSIRAIAAAMDRSPSTVSRELNRNTLSTRGYVPHAAHRAPVARRRRRGRLPTARLVYLEAHEDTRRGRYAMSAATDPVKAGTTFDAAVDHDTERRAGLLRPLADAVVQTDGLDAAAVVAEVAALLGLDRADRQP
jgi:RNase adaptor protein for sRNA GlmZ degradation